MPALIQMVPEKPDFKNTCESIQVIRIKHPDTVVRKKEKLKPQKPKKKDIQKHNRPLKISKPIKRKIHLPFKLNPKLVSGAQTLSVPSIEMLSMKIPDLKNAYGVHEIDAPLTPLVKIPPMYPIRAKRRTIEGWVRVRFLVDKEGSVEHVEILKADPVSFFETSVLNCISRWRFKPGTVEGIPVKTWAETTIHFEMENS
jgi:protein TonB